MSQYACQPLSRDNLRKYAEAIRQELHFENCLYFPVEKFLEILPFAIGDEDLYIQAVNDQEWILDENTHAYYDLNDNCIYIKESVYYGACDGNGRDRMTIIHECAHVLLIKHSHVQLHRRFGKIKPYEDPEWQAKCLAGELMIPKHLVQGMTASTVAEKCGVSLSAAQYQLSCY